VIRYLLGLLRLAGPLQSWGERSAFSVRDSATFPTQSGLCGMFAAAEGRDRMADPGCYAAREFTVRVDRPGRRLVDYHTVGGGLVPERTVATSGGKHKGAAVVSRRHCLADAVFVVAVTGPDRDIERIAHALERPHWAPYLGRRSCVPDEPLLLRAHVPDAEKELRHHVPLTEPDPPPEDDVRVDFLWERPPPGLPDDATSLDIADVPESFAPHHRRYGTRRLYRTEETLPRKLLAPQSQLHDRLISYALGAAT
jgi:CRISPR system Cascade subunit CasD